MLKPRLTNQSIVHPQSTDIFIKFVSYEKTDDWNVFVFNRKKIMKGRKQPDTFLSPVCNSSNSIKFGLTLQLDICLDQCEKTK